MKLELPGDVPRVGVDLHGLMAQMYPICRSITGEGVRRTLDILEQWISLQRHEVATGTPVFDWEVPREWSVRGAYIADMSGKRLVDFDQHNLHLVSYSVPVDAVLSRSELEPHLYLLPEHPDWIPYRTSYYNDHWGFCLRHRDRESLGEGPFRVVVDTDLRPGHLTYGECIIKGSTDRQAIVFAHACHPSMANDCLSGVVLAAGLARWLARQQPRLTWRFVFAPATIGSLTWLSRNESDVGRIDAGMVMGPLGDAAPLAYKRSRRGDCLTDRVAESVLREIPGAADPTPFEPYGYDERQFCSPGFDLPVGRFSRSPNGGYPEYHTSADDLEFVKAEHLAGSFEAIARAIARIDANRTLVNLKPKGEPRLGKRGLYGSVGGMSPQQFQLAMLWTLSLGDGRNDLVEVARRSGIAFETIESAAAALEEAGLLGMAKRDGSISPRSE